MKISSQNNASEILAVGVNVAEQTKQASKNADFRTYMQQSGQTKQTAADHQRSQGLKDNQKDVADNTHTVRESEDTKAANETTYESRTQTDTGTDAEQMDNVEITEENLRASAEVIVAALFQQLETLSEDISDQLQSFLGVSQEQLGDLLNMLGLETADLLDTDVVGQLVLASQDAQPVDMLTNETLRDLVVQAETMVGDLIEQAGLNVDDLTELIPSFKSLLKENVQETDQNLQLEVQVQNTPHADAFSDVKLTVETEQSRMDQEMNQEKQPDFSMVKENVIGQIKDAMIHYTEAVDTVESVTPEEIVKQVVDQIKLTVRQDTTSMELQLYPQHLGKVAVQVSSRNGAVTAQITAENEMARAALESSIQTLKEAFQNQGLKVEAVEIAVATSGFQGEQLLNQQADDQPQGGSKGNRRLNLNDLEDAGSVENLTEEENLNVEMMRQEGRSVDYTA